MLGRLFLNVNEIKTKRLSNHTNQYFIQNRIENITNVSTEKFYIFMQQNELILNLIPATGLIKLAWGLKKASNLKIISWENI